jgi:putative ATPase
MTQANMFGGADDLQPQTNLNSENLDKHAPLAARLRPRNFDEYIGQQHLIAPNSPLRRAVEYDRLGSLILWGPPGVGKTTLAEIIARLSHAHFARISATNAGVADLRKVVEDARRLRKVNGQRTILFIDEIHRFNKAQQDAILPVVENGTVTLIGATTENPSFEVNAALLSRARVYVMYALTEVEIKAVISQALNDVERGLGNLIIELEPQAENTLAILANGDARAALNMLEMVVSTAPAKGTPTEPIRISQADVETAVQHRALLYDKDGEQHYDIISALHKSVRGSDPDATLYWLGRMLEGGEDPLYVARRLVRMAVEDIGLADPQALPLAMAAQQAVHFIGLPEGALALAECAVYLATAPKSNHLYTAYNQVVKDVQTTRTDPVPLHLRNAPTKLMENLGYGKGYKYAHDYDEAIVAQQNLPDAIKEQRYYQPSSRGYEKILGERLEAWQRLTAATPPADDTQED